MPSWFYLNKGNSFSLGHGHNTCWRMRHGHLMDFAFLILNGKKAALRLREALIKYAAISPGSPKAEIILKAHIFGKKLQKLAVGPEGTLEEL